MVSAIQFNTVAEYIDVVIRCQATLQNCYIICNIYVRLPGTFSIPEKRVKLEEGDTSFFQFNIKGKGIFHEIRFKSKFK